MFFDLPHVASRLYGTPLLVARPKLEVILGALGPKLAGEPLAERAAEAQQRSQLRITESGIAVLPVMGTLVRRGSYLSAVSGLTSYHDIEANAQEAFTHPDVGGVLLEIDSCGGEAGGLFDLVDSLRDMAKATGKPLWAVADEAALSAAYAIACAADKIILPRTAEVGSVGVVAVHVDESAADARAGLAYTYIHAGARKVDGNPHEPLASDVRQRLQADVDALYDGFVEMVAKRRRCAPEAVRATEAAVFRGQDAVAAGLADAVGTFRQAHDLLAAHLEKQSPKTLHFLTATPQEVSMSGENVAAAADTVNFELVETTVLHPDAQYSAAPQSQAPSQAQMQAAAEAQVCARLTELSDIAAQAGRLGITVDPVAALREGIKPDALRRQVLEEAATRDASTAIVSAHAMEPEQKTSKAGGSALSQAVSNLCAPKEKHHA